MNLITRNNYEAYLLDYVEENLSPELIAELMLFFENNPELKEELDEFEIHELKPPSTFLTDKLSLKKDENSVTLANYEGVVIAEIEGENALEASNDLHSFLEKNPTKQLDFIAYQKTKLIAPAIILEDKEALKRKEAKIIPIYWWYTSAAAVIIILFILNVFTSLEQENLPVANQEEVVLPKNNNKEEIISNELIVEENKGVVIKEKNSDQQQEPKYIVKKPPSNFVPEKEKVEEVALADKSDKIIFPIADSIPEKIIEELPVEEIQYADNVKITYEDELAINNPKDEYKTVGQIISQPFKKKFSEIFKSSKPSN